MANTPPGKEEGNEEELFEMLEFHEELRSRTESKASDIGKAEKKNIESRLSDEEKKKKDGPEHQTSNLYPASQIHLESLLILFI